MALLLRKTREAYKQDPNAGANANYIAPFSPSPAAMIDTVLDRLHLRTSDVVYDLGCGDGRWLLGAARRGARAVGIEIDGALVARARASAQQAGPEVASRMEVSKGDLFAAMEGEAFRRATVIIVYAFATALGRIQSCLTTLPAGVRIVSVGFTPKGNDWAPQWTERVTGLRVSLYTR